MGWDGMEKRGKGKNLTCIDNSCMHYSVFCEMLLLFFYVFSVKGIC